MCPGASHTYSGDVTIQSPNGRSYTSPLSQTSGISVPFTGSVQTADLPVNSEWGNYTATFSPKIWCTVANFLLDTSIAAIINISQSPMVTISGPPGVPVGASDTYSIHVTPASNCAR